MSFDTLAPHYRTMELILAGNILQRCRTAFLSSVISCRRALLVGEGPGRFLVELMRRSPGVEVHCLEQSPAMIREAQHAIRCRGLSESRVVFQEADALRWQPSEGVFDLVVTHFFLDCFRGDELEGLVAKLAASAKRSARWLLADFRLPDYGWRRWRGQIVMAGMYWFFRCTTKLSASRLTPPDMFLQDAGFQRRKSQSANFGLVRSDLWERGQP